MTSLLPSHLKCVAFTASQDAFSKDYITACPATHRDCLEYRKSCQDCEMCAVDMTKQFMLDFLYVNDSC